jgi:high affinity Mn2+ porin
MDPDFRSPHVGEHSLIPGQQRETWDVTFYLGLRLWQGAELWIDPEIDQGFGLSDTFGVAGYPSGEAYKLGEAVPYARIPRYFVRDTINLGGASEKVEATVNKFSGSQTANRLVFTLGKFSITAVFDTNQYAHDPRADWMNWALVDTGTFDYASDAWVYTYGAAAEWYHGDSTMRAGLFDLSTVPGSTDLDPTFKQFQTVAELERRYRAWGQPGKVAVTGYLSSGRMGTTKRQSRYPRLLPVPAEKSKGLPRPTLPLI